ncbi:MFS transporter [Falsiroseomonas stagni]|uniref:Predicted arabinose efflux permease, MFS family n=1 Tax=Falsiroseomonas stagni DSM 19981 TaxID=1123062 RepID=A0A1I4DDM7_9PROT|nr:MFS transporter [Falsiroseomonas stagni]SFK91758.1 Predicted arabinose efflux permease, MFS family [Falsiroseomonas stagni DSM 19981]
MTSRPVISAGLLMTCAVLAAALAMGLRNSFGLFLAPMTEQNLWTASGFSFAIALQVLMNGISQPLCGQLADRFGGRAVVIGGALLYAGGILGMALATHLGVFTVFAGVIMGVAVSAAGMPVIISTLTRLLPENQRGRAAGLGTAGSSFGQFLVVPMAGLGIATIGWQATMIGMAAVALLMIPLSFVLAEPPRTKVVAASEESATDALKRAFRTPSFWFLFFGFFVCGLHISFLTTHLPGFVHTCGLPVAVGAGAISLIGLFNIVGSLGAGELTQRWKRRELLVTIYALRGVLMATFMMVEKTTTTVLIFSAFMGILYLSTVPPTIALVARNFGTRWLATIFGLVFLGHQIGGFTGAWLGGVVLDRTGNYDAMWWAGVAASAFAALIHLPVKDPAPQAVAKPAAA